MVSLTKQELQTRDNAIIPYRWTGTLLSSLRLFRPVGSKRLYRYLSDNSLTVGSHVSTCTANATRSTSNVVSLILNF